MRSLAAIAVALSHSLTTFLAAIHRLAKFSGYINTSDSATAYRCSAYTPVNGGSEYAGRCRRYSI
jgi:hypothetical protein